MAAAARLPPNGNVALPDDLGDADAADGSAGVTGSGWQLLSSQFIY